MAQTIGPLGRKNLTGPQPVSRSTLNNQLQGLQHENPRIYNLLKEVIKALELMARDISTRELIQAALLADDEQIRGLTATIHRQYVEISWLPIAGKTFLVKRGPQEDSADIIFLTTNNIVLVDADTFFTGEHTFYVGVFGADEFESITFEAGFVGLIEIQQVQEFVNTLYLSWAEPVSDFEIAHYELWIGETLLARTRSTTYLHVTNSDLGGMLRIRAVDIAGNDGAETLINISLSQPNNFFNIASRIDTVFDGEKVNAFVLSDGSGLILPVDTAESFETRDIPQDTIAEAAVPYPYWAQPSSHTDGLYTKEFDFGQVYNNVYLRVLIACIDLDEEHRHVLQREVRYKSEAIGSWTIFTGGISTPVSAVRFVEVDVRVSPSANLRTICILRQIQVQLALAFAEDSGEVRVINGSGQQVDFSVDFSVKPNVTATVLTNQDYTATVSGISPSSFTLHVHDTDGDPVNNQLVEWHARGGI